MKRLLKTFSVISVLFLLSCNNGEKNNSTGKTDVTEPSAGMQRKIEAKIFRNDTIPGSNITGFGYNIFIDGNPYVHQPHIPAVSGLKGFSTEEDARKVAAYAAKKLEMTGALPRISQEELDSLGIKY